MLTKNHELFFLNRPDTVFTGTGTQVVLSVSVPRDQNHFFPLTGLEVQTLTEKLINLAKDTTSETDVRQNVFFGVTMFSLWSGGPAGKSN